MDGHDLEEFSTSTDSVAATNGALVVNGDGDLALSRRYTDPLLPSQSTFDLRLRTNAFSTPSTLDVRPTVNGGCGGSEIFDDGQHKQWAVSVGVGDSSSSSSSGSGVGGGVYSNYTSLRDLLPGLSAQSPTFHKSGDIPIRNPLVKQAAYAYLQPKVSPGPAPRRCWLFGGRRAARDDDGGVGPCFGCVQCFAHLFDVLLAMMGLRDGGSRDWMNGHRR